MVLFESSILMSPKFAQLHKSPMGDVSVGLAMSQDDEELLKGSDADVERSEKGSRERPGNPKLSEKYEGGHEEKSESAADDVLSGSRCSAR